MSWVSRSCHSAPPNSSVMESITASSFGTTAMNCAPLAFSIDESRHITSKRSSSSSGSSTVSPTATSFDQSIPESHEKNVSPSSSLARRRVSNQCVPIDVDPNGVVFDHGRPAEALGEAAAVGVERLRRSQVGRSLTLLHTSRGSSFVICCCSMMMPSSSASGRGGQPGT